MTSGHVNQLFLTKCITKIFLMKRMLINKKKRGENLRLGIFFFFFIAFIYWFLCFLKLGENGFHCLGPRVIRIWLAVSRIRHIINIPVAAWRTEVCGTAISTHSHVYILSRWMVTTKLGGGALSRNIYTYISQINKCRCNGRNLWDAICFIRTIKIAEKIQRTLSAYKKYKCKWMKIFKSVWVFFRIEKYNVNLY